MKEGAERKEKMAGDIKNVLLGAAMTGKKVIEEQRRREEERRRREEMLRRQQEEARRQREEMLQKQREEQRRKRETEANRRAEETLRNVATGAVVGAGLARGRKGAGTQGTRAPEGNRSQSSGVDGQTENESKRIELPQPTTKSGAWELPTPQSTAWDTIFKRAIERAREGAAHSPKTTAEESFIRRGPDVYQPWGTQPKNGGIKKETEIRTDPGFLKGSSDEDAPTEVVPRGKADAVQMPWWQSMREQNQVKPANMQTGDAAASDFWAVEKKSNFEKETLTEQPKPIWNGAKRFDEDVPELEALFADAWRDNQKRGTDDEERMAEAIWREADGGTDGFIRGNGKNAQKAMEMVYNGGEKALSGTSRLLAEAVENEQEEIPKNVSEISSEVIAEKYRPQPGDFVVPELPMNERGSSGKDIENKTKIIGVLDVCLEDERLGKEIKDSIARGNTEGNFSNVVIKDYQEKYISDEEAREIKRVDEQTNLWGKAVTNVALAALLKGAAKGGHALIEKVVPAILGGATLAKEGYDVATDDYKEPKAGNYIEATVVIGQVNDQNGKKIYPAREVKLRVCADDFENSAINQFLPTTL